MNLQFRLSGWLVLAIFLTAGQTFSQVHKSMQDRSFRTSTVTMKYRLFVPKNYDAQKNYPFIVVMHGVGEKGSDNMIQVDREDLASTWMADSLQNRVPHFVMGPQCPSDLSWGSSVAIQMVHSIIDSLKREFNLDTNRLYVAGLSMGARGTFNLLEMRPGYFAAALACAGAGNNNGAKSIGQTPIWAFHATGDAIVNVSGTRSMVEAIENTGIRFVRFISESWTNSPSLTTYSDAIRNGTNPLDMVAKNPKGISYDSLKHAVEGGAKYLYSEITGGDHRTGWMVAFHHPLVPQWIFSKTKNVTTKAYSIRILKQEDHKNATMVLFQNITGDFTRQFYSLQGQRITMGKGENNRRYEICPAVAVSRFEK